MFHTLFAMSWVHIPGMAEYQELTIFTSFWINYCQKRGGNVDHILIFPPPSYLFKSKSDLAVTKASPRVGSHHLTGLVYIIICWTLSNSLFLFDKFHLVLTFWLKFSHSLRFTHLIEDRSMLFTNLNEDWSLWFTQVRIKTINSCCTYTIRCLFWLDKIFQYVLPSFCTYITICFVCLSSVS